MFIRWVAALGAGLLAGPVLASGLSGFLTLEANGTAIMYAKKLEGALQRFEREVAGKRKGGAAARSSKPKEIVVVGSKVKDVVRSPATSEGQAGFSEVTGLATEISPAEYRSGQEMMEHEPQSLKPLLAAIHRLEGVATPASPCVRICKSHESRCLAGCQNRLRAQKVTGRCICAAVRARCLLRESKLRKCYPPDPGKQPRGRLGPLRR